MDAKLINRHRKTLSHAFGDAAVPCLDVGGNAVELGRGRHGAVFKLASDDVVLKLTCDQSEAKFVQAALRIGEWPLGLVKHQGITELDERVDGQRVWAIVRQAALHVGFLLDDCVSAEVRQGRERTMTLMAVLRIHAHVVRYFLESAKDPIEARHQLGDGYEKDGRLYVERGLFAPPKTSRDGRALQAAVSLITCEDTACAIGDPGHAFQFYLRHGILICDVRPENIGLISEEGDVRPVLTDPGNVTNIWAMPPVWD